MFVKKRLSDTEFEVMKAVWNGEEPVTTVGVMESIGKAKNWKQQTVVTLMKRLEGKGYLRSEKPGKERIYFSQVRKEEYLASETKEFMELYHENSLSSLISALNQSEVKEKDLKELEEILKKGAR